MGQVIFVESVMFILTLLYSVTDISSNVAELIFFCCLDVLNMGVTMHFQPCLGLSALTTSLLELVVYNFVGCTTDDMGPVLPCLC